MHIGLLGGSFNPIHCGHLHIAEQAQAECYLDHILFIPTGDPPHKKSNSLAPAHHRLTMVEMALEHNPAFTASDIEIRSTNVSYTVDTLTKLQHMHQEVTHWSFIIGLDAFLEFHTWKEAPRLLELCNFIVCSRPDVDFTNISSVSCLPPISPQSLQNLEKGHIHKLPISLPTGKQLTFLSLPPCKASASLIRTYLQERRTVSDWLPPSIESYILEHHLFQA
ncbi:MAG: putative nicotinate-nucleotide adenylyltransferase [Nitrospirales bacterium]|nr:MAG: putative nicotinate-nucleotide adenylyltransferase [Nitrospirales bacterium]